MTEFAELETVVLVKCDLTVEDAATLSKTIERRGLRLVVVRPPKEEIDDDSEWGIADRQKADEAERVWGEVKEVLVREVTEVDVRVITPRPSLVDETKWWFKRVPRPYEW